MWRLIIANNSVVKFQNLVLNHKSWLVKLNPVLYRFPAAFYERLIMVVFAQSWLHFFIVSWLLKVFLMLLIMHKICLNESFKKQDCKVLKKKMQNLLLFQVVFCGYYLLKKRNFWCFKAMQTYYLRDKLTKKKCFYSLNYDFGNKFCNSKTVQF